MQLTRGSALVIGLAAAVVAGCGHGEPFSTPDYLGDEPFDATEPHRLTWATGANVRPSFSEDGRYLLYSHDHPDTREENHQPDRCLGVLPASGGQRLATICGENPPVDPRSGQAPFRVGIEHGALGADGQLAYVLQVGRTNSFSSTSAALYVGALDRPGAARRVLDLKRVPAGALGRWDYLLDLAWVGPDRLVALAAEATLVPPGPFADPDTILSGVEVVELDVSTNEATWRRIAVAPGARMMAWDRSAGRALIVQGNTVVDTWDGSIVHQAAPPAWAAATTISGIAVAAGRVYIAEVSTNGPRAEAVISRLADGGTPQPLWGATGDGAARFVTGHLAVDPAATRLVFEGLGAGSLALYLQEISP